MSQVKEEGVGKDRMEGQRKVCRQTHGETDRNRNRDWKETNTESHGWKQTEMARHT